MGARLCVMHAEQGNWKTKNKYYYYYYYYSFIIIFIKIIHYYYICQAQVQSKIQVPLHHPPTHT